VIVLVWVTLGVFVLLVLGSAVFATVRGLEAWRTFRHFRRRVPDGLDDMTRRIARIESRLSNANASAARLARAQAELGESIATARVLSGAMAEVRTAVGRVTGFIPSK
jgi:hypothetical protein